MTGTGEALPGTELAGGRYTLKARLGATGVADVYQGWGKHLQADVDVKLPSPGLLRDPSFVARFLREVRSLIRLSHPRVVRVLDTGEHHGRPYAILQHLGGGNLRNRQKAPDGAVRPLPLASLET